MHRAIDDIAMIKMNVENIQNHLQRKYVKNGYSFITWSAIPPIQSVQVFFELNYRDWLKLQKSKEWKAFVKCLRKHQNKYNRTHLQKKAR